MTRKTTETLRRSEIHVGIISCTSQTAGMNHLRETIRTQCEADAEVLQEEPDKQTPSTEEHATDTQ